MLSEASSTNVYMTSTATAITKSTRNTNIKSTRSTIGITITIIDASQYLPYTQRYGSRSEVDGAADEDVIVEPAVWAVFVGLEGGCGGEVVFSVAREAYACVFRVYICRIRCHDGVDGAEFGAVMRGVGELVVGAAGHNHGVEGGACHFAAYNRYHDAPSVRSVARADGVGASGMYVEYVSQTRLGSRSGCAHTCRQGSDGEKYQRVFHGGIDNAYICCKNISIA